MSIIIVIECDGPDCSKREEVPHYVSPGEKFYPHSLRKVLRDEDGWKQLGSRDYCPLCQDKVPRGEVVSRKTRKE